MTEVARRDPHERLMRVAIAEARRAARAGEVPVGAVVAISGRVVARAGNRVERDRDATAHAELIAIRRALRRTGEKWLIGATLYATLEPCPQCAGALLLARVSHVVYGAADSKGGAFGSATDFPQSGRLNHGPRVTAGVMAAASREILAAFFVALRRPSPVV